MKKATSILLMISAALGLVTSFLGLIFLVANDGMADFIYQLAKVSYPEYTAHSLASQYGEMIFYFAVFMIIGGTIGFIVSAIALAKLNRAKSYHEFRAIAIAVVITGFVSTIPQIVAGAMMLKIEDRHLN